MEIKKIFKRVLALELVNKNHKLVYTEPNINIPKFRVFCFMETKELLDDITILTQK